MKTEKMKVSADRLNTVEEYYFSTKLKEVNSLIKKVIQ